MKRRLLVLLFLVLSILIADAYAKKLTSYPVEGGTLYFDDETGLINGAGGTITRLDIPSEINGTRVTTVRGLSYNRNLVIVTIPDGVATIMDNTFEQCINLKYISISDTVTSIGQQAFSGTAIKTINLPANITSIQSSAFRSCHLLTKITIPEKVTRIDAYSFSGCTGLCRVDMSSNVRYIGAAAFEGCSSLNYIFIPGNVTKLDNFTFYGCSNLSAITIPAGVTTIGLNAFGGCSRLTDVYFGGSEAEWKSISIDKCNECLKNATIHYNSIQKPIDQSSDLILLSCSPSNGARDYESGEMCLVFSETINPNLNWSAGSIRIVEYSTGQVKLTIDKNNYNFLNGRVLDDTLTIPNALSNLSEGRYYLLIDSGLILAAEPDNSDRIKSYEGITEEFVYAFTIVGSTERVRIDFCGTPMEIRWNWGLLSGDATKAGYQQDLAVASLALCSASSGDDPSNVKATINALGFDRQILTVKFDTYFNVNAPAVAIGSTKQLIDGREKTIIVIVVRGTQSLETNLDTITDLLSEFSGFLPAARFAKKQLDEYIASYCANLSKEDTILLMTGHSLGGATIGALSTMTSDIADRKNTFVYTFASPNYDTQGLAGSYFTNIVNVINPKDIVPAVPVGLNYHKLGEVRSLSIETQKNFDEAYIMVTGKAFNKKTFLDEHFCTTYMALVLSQEPKEGFSSYFRVSGIHCPVDIRVIKSNGEFMAGVSEGRVTYSEESDVLILIDGDEKYVYMPSIGDYRIELAASEQGTMEYIVQNIDAETGLATEEKIFSNVVLFKGKQMINDLDENEEISETKLIALDTNGNTSEMIQGSYKSYIPMLKAVFYGGRVKYSLREDVPEDSVVYAARYFNGRLISVARGQGGVAELPEDGDEIKVFLFDTQMRPLCSYSIV